MITCIAVDDEPMALEVIERYCTKSDLVELKAVFREPVKAVEYLGRVRIDLIFVDITAINKAVAALPGKQSSAGKDDDASVFFKSGPQTYQVRVRDILWLEKDGNYINLHLKDRTILIRESMVDIFDLVSPAEFIRVHKSYVVAIKHIAMIETHQLTINGEKIPIGSTYRETLRSRLGID